MEVPTLDLKKQYDQLKDEIDGALEEVKENTAFILGPAVERFEKNFADYCGANQCVGVNSGTAALQLIYEALELNEGKEVITTPFTFIATVEPLLHIGAQPVFADIDPDTFNLDPVEVEKKITDKTKAIVAVHLYGHPQDMNPLRELAEAHDLKLIEDAAQAHGALYNDRRVGGLADAGAFSFYPGKNLGAFGDAGAVTTSDPELAEKVKKLRDHGRDGKYSHSFRGHNERMDGFQGAVLDVKLDYIDGWNAGRRKNADFYNSELSALPVKTPTVADYAEHVYHQYVIRTDNRDRVAQYLQDNDIGAGVHYPIPLHKQPSMEVLGYDDGDFPVAEKAAREVLSLPVFSALQPEQLNYVVETLKEAVDQ
ncbi:MAG: DegT/DnrJ/EryC1/StrS family aminotransferase [bacterium]